MRASVYHGPRDIRVEDVPDATLQSPTDALVRVTHACVCGSDLWPYRGALEIYGRPGRTGHEFVGVVEAVGADVRTVRPGDRVIAPFAFSDGTCDYCAKGLQTSCRNGGYWGGENDGGQGEAVRAPLADGTLVLLPADAALSDDRLAAAIATLSDVMGTGHHGAVSAGVTPGATVVIVGDGAVGLCAVLAARRLGAERIIVLGRHAHRLEMARSFGATDLVAGRREGPSGSGAGDHPDRADIDRRFLHTDDLAGGVEEVLERVRELTDGGAAHVIECVGTAASFATAIGSARPGGIVGHLGMVSEPVGLLDVHNRNIRIIGGVAPVRAYLADLLPEVLDGRLDPSPVLDLTVGLEDVPAGYAAMDERRAIKVLVRVGGA
jgi:threonine dehydrogenase-like Zn-dependent dehydrogenase